MKDRSVSVLVTVSVCRSKTLIGAAISLHCMSAACQMEMECIWYSAEWMRDQLKKLAARQLSTHQHTWILNNWIIHTKPLLSTRHFPHYFLQNTHTVLFISLVFISHCTVCICGCCLHVCDILASSSSCWHLIFTHQFFSHWLNTAVRCATQHLTNICPSRVVYVSAATLRWAEFASSLMTTEEVSVLYIFTRNRLLSSLNLQSVLKSRGW